MAYALRDGLDVETGPAGELLLVDRRTGGAPHAVPAPFMGALRAAIASGGALPPPLEGWLEARHLVASDRVSRVEAWGEARIAVAAPKTIAILPGARFTCHGCGQCCESYTLGPVTAAERARVLERAADLAPFIPTPVEGWFVERRDFGVSEEVGTYALGRTPGGCVFLGKDRLCEIHRHLGPELKPLPCRQFPLQVTRRPDGIAVTVRPECETLWRSRDDGQPLAEQQGWIGAIVSEVRKATDIPRTVRAIQDVFVPYALGRAIERRALGYMNAAPTVEQAHLAIRDLVLGVARGLKVAPETADLDRAEGLASSGSLQDLRAARGPTDPSAAMEALAAIVHLLLDALPEYERTRHEEVPGTLTAKNVALTSDVVRTLAAALAARRGAPPPEGISEAAIEEARRAAATPSGADQPPVIDLVRSSTIELIGSSRALAASPGFVYGFAHLALVHFVARWTARLLASRRGAKAASREDWNHAFAQAHRSMFTLNLAPAAAAVVTFYAHLFATEDLPT